MFRRLYERLFFCARGQHRDYAFNSFNLPSGTMRVMRCLSCRNLIDVTYNSESTLLLKLEDQLSTIPGYPAQERFR